MLGAYFKMYRPSAVKGDIVVSILFNSHYLSMKFVLQVFEKEAGGKMCDLRGTTWQIKGVTTEYLCSDLCR
jgi:hypothetical protein